MFSIRNATTSDIAQFAKTQIPTTKAWAAELDGELIAIAGFAFIKGRWLAFCDLTKMANDKLTGAHGCIWKLMLARAVKEKLDSLDAKYVYADPDDNYDGARRWLMRLGFEPHGRLYRRKRKARQS